MVTIKSFGYSQQDIINNILELHSENKTIDVDPTYSKGVFYKNNEVEQPKYKFDLFPQTDDTVEADSSNLPLEDNSVKTIMFDPPFVISGKTYSKSKKGSCIIAKRFGGYEDFESLKTHWFNSLKEFYRILEDKGIVIFKLQNTISSGKQHFSHYFTIKSALDLGFYPKDEFILINKSKITSFGGRWKNQIHSMKHHSYFLVFEKRKSRVNYE